MAASNALQPGESEHPIGGAAGLNPGETEHPLSPKGTDQPGSVFDNPTVGQRLKRIGKGLLTATAAGGTAATGTITGAEIGTALEGGVPGPGTVIGAGIGGLIGGAGAAMMPPAKGVHVGFTDIVRSAAINAAFGVAGEAGPLLGAGKAASVAGEIRALPEEAQTVGNVKQALRNRTALKSMGATDEQIDAASNLVDVDKIAEAGKRYKAAYQGVVDHTREQFTNRYNTVLGKVGTFESIKAEPELVGILRDQTKIAMDELRSRMGPTTTASKQFGGLSPELVTNLENAIPDNASIADLRAVGTQIRNLRNSPTATNPMKAALNQIDEQLQTTIKDSLKSAGATPEQIGAINAIDEDYGRFQDVLQKIDPRSERYGTDVANALFDPMLTNPNDAVNFIKMAKEANGANPSIMPQLRSAFIDKVIADTKVAAQGRPVEEMRLLQHMQSQWGGKQGTKTVLSEMFGEDSLMSNPTVAGRVLGKLANADQAAADASNGLMKFIGKLGTPAWVVRLGTFYAMVQAAGGHGGLFQNIQKPEVLIPAVTAMFISGKVANVALGSADRAFQKAYVNWLLTPNPSTVTTLTKFMGGAGVAAETGPQHND